MSTSRRCTRRWRSCADCWTRIHERTSVGELFGDNPELAASYCGDHGLHMVFNFEFTHRRWDPQAFGEAIERADRSLAADGWPCYVLSNHDLPRHVTRYGGRHPDEVARVAAALLLTQRGTPFVYYGEEIGLPDVPLRRDQLVDPPGRRYWPFYKGRDPNRGPMPWDTGLNAGFTRGAPWLPLRSDHGTLNVETQRRDPRSVWSFYRDLLRLRRDTPALRRGNVPAREPPFPRRPGLSAHRTRRVRRWWRSTFAPLRCASSSNTRWNQPPGRSHLPHNPRAQRVSHRKPSNSGRSRPLYSSVRAEAIAARLAQGSWRPDIGPRAGRPLHTDLVQHRLE